MKVVIYLTLALFTGALFGQESSGVTVTITIPNLASSEGKASAALYDETRFMRAAPLQSSSSTIENGQVLLKFENVKPGSYGIITLHDLNDNGRMDFEPNGMPKEDYGISGTGAGFGPPTWNDSKMDISTEDVHITIRM